MAALCPLGLQVQRLLALQRSHGGVIELDPKTFQELLVGKSRPYSVIIVAGGCALCRRKVGEGLSGGQKAPPRR